MIDTMFNLLNRETVEVLQRNDPKLLPPYKVNEPKDFLWNQQHVASVLMDGVLSGKNVRDMARDLGRVTNMNQAAVMRTARTALNSSNNQGRMDAYERAKNLGIKGKVIWIATIDDRTRDTHALLDGEEIELGGKFSNGLEYPGDASGEPGEVYNCRCTTGFHVADVDLSDAQRDMFDAQGFSRIEDMSYEQWREQHANRLEGKGGLYADVLANYLGRIAPVAAPAAAESITYAVVEFGDAFKKAVPSHIDNIEGILASAPEDARAVWNRYADKLEFKTATKRGNGAYYSKMDRGVSMNVAKAAKGNEWEKPYGVLFHEFGHHIDNASMWGSGGWGRWFSYEFRDASGRSFSEVLTKEVNAIVDARVAAIKAAWRATDGQWLYEHGVTWFPSSNANTKYSIANARKAVAHDVKAEIIAKHGEYGVADISDMFEGATNAKVQMGYGHGKSYWKNSTNLPAEAFAEMFQATICNQESLAAIREYLPESYEFFEGMLKELANGQ